MKFQNRRAVQLIIMYLPRLMFNLWDTHVGLPIVIHSSFVTLRTWPTRLTGANFPASECADSFAEGEAAVWWYWAKVKQDERDDGRAERRARASSVHQTHVWVERNSLYFMIFFFFPHLCHTHRSVHPTKSNLRPTVQGEMQSMYSKNSIQMKHTYCIQHEHI